MTSNTNPAKQVFLDVIEKHSAENWEAALASLCGEDQALVKEVKVLLKGHIEFNSMLDGAGIACTMPAEESLSVAPGTRVGPYKLLEPIGEGGMGTVYMAEQLEPVKRRVAIKLIKPGMDSKQVSARFEAERQALAVMDHPNIAKIHDAGSTDDGRPFFAMELVKGLPITRFCDQQKLPLDARLRLFRQVCLAVQHAHQKGIIHRDLKPSNIMVAMYDDQPVPKVIDFGVAKAISGPLTENTCFTRFGEVVGTLNYMSPEQAQLNQLDIDTRSDIYSLGVVLYELLVGEPPFDKQRMKSQAFDETLKMIREEEPTKPSAKLSSASHSAVTATNRATTKEKLNSTVRGDLDWIVMKAIEKNRAKRYDTASDFASDIRRYMDFLPILAGPPSTAYRIKKFARRHQVPLIVGFLMASIIMISSSLALVLILKESNRRKNALAERNLALEETEKSRDQYSHLFDFILREIVDAANPGSSPDDARDITVRQALVDANEKVDLAFTDQRSRAFVKHNLGVFLKSIGEYTRARDDFEASLEILNGLGADEDRFYVADSEYELIEVYWRLGDHDAALTTARALLSFLSQSNDDIDREVLYLKTMRQLGVMLYIEKKYEDGIEVLQQVIELAAARKHEQLHALALLDLGNCNFGQQEYDRAESIWNEALAEFEQHGDRLNAATVLSNLAMLYWETNRQEESIAVGQKAAETAEEILGPTHPQALDYRQKVASNKFQVGEWSEAAEDFRAILKSTIQRYGENHEKSGSAMGSLGAVLESEGKLDEAIVFQKKALNLLKSLHGNKHSEVLRVLAGLGSTSAAMKDYEQAAEYFQEVIVCRREILLQEPENWSNARRLGGAYCNLGLVFADNESNQPDAIDAFSEGITVLENLELAHRTTLGKRFLVNSYVARSESLGKLLRFEEAFLDADKAILIATTEGRRNAMRLKKARLLTQVGEYEEAVQLVDEITAITDDADMFYLAAEVVSQALIAILDSDNLDAGERNRLDKQYTNDSLDFLEKALALGYFNIETRIGDFENESSFGALRDHPKFQSLSKQIHSKRSTKD